MFNTASDTKKVWTTTPNGEALAQRIISLYAAINRATHEFLKLLREFDDAKLAVQEGFLSTPQWLSYYCGIGPNAAREKLRVAAALRTLPHIDDAFERGMVSYSKVRALSRVATAGNELGLLQIARNATASQLERILTNYRHATSATHPVEPELSLTWRYNERGELLFRGRLPADLGELLVRAVAREMESDLPAPDAPPLAERRAEALTRIAESAHARADEFHSSAERHLVHVELNATPEPALRPHIPAAGPLVQAAVERLTCDASLVAHEHGADGEPLSVGRKTRTVPSAVRRALQRRDAGCRWPGCTHTRFVDAHHVVHWAHGGETKLDNMLLLCRRHHRLVHEGGGAIVAEQPARGAVRFHFLAADGVERLPVADDLSKVVLLPQQKVSAETPSRLQPEQPDGRPDYDHIVWYLANFVPPD